MRRLYDLALSPKTGTLDVGDFATIEVRVLFGLRDTKGLDTLASGKAPL